MGKVTGKSLMLSLSVGLNDRLLKQSERMSANKSMLIRMALTKYLEELERTEPGGEDGKKKI